MGDDSSQFPAPAGVVVRSPAVSLLLALYSLLPLIIVPAILGDPEIPPALRGLYVVLLGLAVGWLVARALRLRVQLDSERVIFANLLRTYSIEWRDIEAIESVALWFFMAPAPATGVGLRRMSSDRVVASTVTLIRRSRNRVLDALTKEASSRNIQVGVTMDELERAAEGLAGVWRRRRASRRMKQ